MKKVKSVNACYWAYLNYTKYGKNKEIEDKREEN